MTDLYWWLQYNRPVVGEHIVRLGTQKPCEDLISYYISENLTYSSNTVNLGACPSVKLMSIYEPLSQKIANPGGIDSMLGYFRKGDKWKLIKFREPDGRVIWGIKIRIKNIPFRYKIVNIYRNIYNVPFSKKFRDFKRDIETFSEFVNQSAIIAGRYLSLNKRNFY